MYYAVLVLCSTKQRVNTMLCSKQLDSYTGILWIDDKSSKKNILLICMDTGEGEAGSGQREKESQMGEYSVEA